MEKKTKTTTAELIKSLTCHLSFLFLQYHTAIPSVQHVTTDDGAPSSQQKQALGANEAARSLYPAIARSLQKYLRLTKQTGRHNLQSIYEHLSKCLLYKLSARTFLEKFTNLDPVWQQNETSLFANCISSESAASCSRLRNDDLEINSWSLVCDTLLSRQLDSGKSISPVGLHLHSWAWHSITNSHLSKKTSHKQVLSSY